MKLCDIIYYVENILAPPVDTGQFPTREIMIVWERHGRRVFLFLVIIALVITFSFHGPDRDWHGPDRQPFVETAVSGHSSVADITVTATPNYHGSN